MPLLGWLDWFRWWRWLVFFADFVDDLQLGPILLISTETNVIATLKHKLRIHRRQKDFRVRGQKILSFVNLNPIVVDQTARRLDRKVRRNLCCDLFETQHTIQLAIDPKTSARTDNGTSTCVRQPQTQG